ncbi:MAG: hypothetical protein KME08_02200 [Aphanothece sp. CMT-3BRIN-NPC111]|nr:hypothetical protein [Aphanothece sp. CMT-3BRIN-NPC111]
MSTTLPAADTALVKPYSYISTLGVCLCSSLYGVPPDLVPLVFYQLRWSQIGCLRNPDSQSVTQECLLALRLASQRWGDKVYLVWS